MNNSINFRDCGGYAASDGRRVKTGMLYRSGSLDRLSGRNRRMVLEANIRTIVDLRPETERARQRAVLPGTRRVTIALDVDRITRERLMPHFRKRNSGGMVDAIISVYRDIVTPTAPAARSIFEILGNGAAYPLCVNCRAGKDRTGYAVAIILRSLGVADDDIMRDYLVTNRNLLPRVRRLTVPLRIVSAGLLPVRAFETALTAHEAALRAALEVIDSRYGGIAGYLDFCGVDAVLLSRVRTHLLE